MSIPPAVATPTNMPKPTDLPLCEPTKFDGQWYYRTKSDAVWVMRYVDDDDLVSLRPVWVLVSRPQTV